jgi:outer membrane protein TolC
MMKINICIFLSVISFTTIQAQQKLSSDEAISIALKNNYDILVAKNSSEVDRINNTAGNAGMLPNIAINASDNYSVNNVIQKYPAGTETKTPEAHSNSLNSGAELNWTLFDGGKMFVTKNKLGQIQTLGEIQFKDQVLQTVNDVIVAYYNVVRQTQQLVSIEEAINSTQVMVNILQTSFSAGLSPKTNLLQAQIDLNEYRENAINQQAVIIASKRSLNQLLSRDPNIIFEVADSIPLGNIPDKNELSQKLYTSNTSVLSFQKQMEIARLSLNEFKTIKLPRVSFNAGYNFLNSNNNYSTVIMNQAFGPQIGGTISIPLYQSGNASRQIETAKLQLLSAEYNLENTKLLVNSELQNTFTNYDNQLQLLEIEKSNMELAKENLSITMERLRLGQTTSLELHQAQQSYVDSQTRFINFEFNLKVAETKLKQLLAILQ